MSGDTGDYYDVDEYYYAELVMKEWQACPSAVAKEYFSLTNIKRIQRHIRREIYNRSYGKFKLKAEQNVHDLLTAMRVVYEQYAKDLPFKVNKQVKYLNEVTVQYIAPDMIVNLKQQYGYLNDITRPIMPIDLPVNVNNAGRLLLPGVAQVYGL